MDVVFTKSNSSGGSTLINPANFGFSSYSIVNLSSSFCFKMKSRRRVEKDLMALLHEEQMNFE